MQTYSKPTAIVREKTKYACVMQCIEKESQGFECIKPIVYKADGYWEAVYRKQSYYE